MKTLFLNPPSFSRFDSAGARFAATRVTQSLWYPAWLGYAAAYVSKSKLIDCPADNISLNQLLGKIKQYELIVIYTSTPSILNDIRVAETIKKINKKCKIIFTGPHVSVLPEETLKMSNVIDAVTIGEFDQIIADVTNKINWNLIKGLCFKQGNNIVNNQPRNPLKDLDRLPYVSKIYKRDLPIFSYRLPFCLHPYISIYAGRGCPNLCTFCLWPQTFTGRIFRKRSVDNVIGEVIWIKNKMPQVKEIFFDDDTFTINHVWVEEFCRKIMPLKITWSVNARADVPYELLLKMKNAGCRLLVIGYESGNDQILKNIKKGISVLQMKKFTEAVKQAGLMIHGTYILGLPGETKQTIKETIKFACELDSDTIQVSLATPFPGTEFYRFCQQKKFINVSSFIDPNGYQLPIISYPNLSSKTIERESIRFLVSFYIRPKYFLKISKKFVSSTDEAKRITRSGWEFLKFLVNHH
ncbi:MAG: hopanoid biosynthesis associated radical SAM protein HpnJ [Candidatus Gottesmanbacteria bacterium]